MFCRAIKPNSAKNQRAFAVKVMRVHFITTRKIVGDLRLCINIGENTLILLQTMEIIENNFKFMAMLY